MVFTISKVIYNIDAEIYFCPSRGDQMCSFQFEIIINVLVIPLHLNTYVIGLRLLLIVNSFNAGIIYRQMNEIQDKIIQQDGVHFGIHGIILFFKNRNLLYSYKRYISQDIFTQNTVNHGL